MDSSFSGQSGSPQVYRLKKRLPKRSLLVELLILAVVVLLGFWITTLHRQKDSLKSSPQLASASSLPQVTYTGDTSNILYPKTNIGSGRQVYYQLPNQGNIPANFSGVGIYYFSVGDQVLKTLPLSNKQGFITVKQPSAFIRYLVAEFDRWEDIPGSPDKYLILKDSSHLLPTNTMLPKIRIGFNQSSPDFKTTFVTTLNVEDLNTVIPKTIASRSGVNLAMIDIMSNLPNDVLAKLVQPGDALSIAFYPKPDGTGDLTDAQRIRVAKFINIRRFDPDKELKIELGRQVIK